MSAVPEAERKTDFRSELIAKAQAGDKAASDELVRANMNLVYALVQRFLNRGYEKEDLVQVGLIGLLKSIANFDLESGNQFSTYAVPMIIGEIKRFIRDDQPVHVSRSYREAGYRVYQERSRFMQAEHREPTMQELASRLDMTVADLNTVLEANRRPTSLQQPTDDGDGGKTLVLGELLGSSESEDDWVDGLLLKETLARLPPRLRYIMECRYFKEWTQEQIAGTLGISQVQVSRLEKQALGLLREYLRQD
jgi:RNA polymerase sporulation-specific sigma factor